MGGIDGIGLAELPVDGDRANNGDHIDITFRRVDISQQLLKGFTPCEDPRVTQLADTIHQLDIKALIDAVTAPFKRGSFGVNTKGDALWILALSMACLNRASHQQQ